MKYASLLLLLATPYCMATSQMRPCGYDDVCEAIVFNQLALAAIREEMKGLVSAFNNTKPSGDLVPRNELSTCETEKQDLVSQIKSLEGKLKEMIPQGDEGADAEREELNLTVEKLRSLNEQLKTEASQLEGEVAKHRERIDQLIKNVRPVDCADVQIQGNTESGVYTVYQNGTLATKDVYCDLETAEGGWTVFLKRQLQTEPVDFNESWENFKNGFGNAESEYWLGNDVIHSLTSQGPSTLRVEAESFSGEKRWAEWSLFNVADEANKYQVTFDQYQETSTLGDSLSSNSGSFFTTFDRDNDHQDELNCAVGSKHSLWGKGGWWYFACGSTRPTAPLKHTDYWNSACWLTFDKEGSQVTSLRNLSMKFRRHNYQQMSFGAN
ncbi:techylectin-5B-like [Macrobrachium rosenbergii]|uniref:techylectin-5B-like n=1 Tax=Macrobrachium rosenbergii TaxID=79674 RepID=UPI0034D61CA9